MSFHEAIALLKTHRVRSAPLLDASGTPVAFVAMGDLVKYLQTHRQTPDELKAQIAAAPQGIANKYKAHQRVVMNNIDIKLKKLAGLVTQLAEDPQRRFIQVKASDNALAVTRLFAEGAALKCLVLAPKDVKVIKQTDQKQQAQSKSLSASSVGVISRKDIVRFLSLHLIQGSPMAPFALSKLCDLPGGVVKVPHVAVLDRKQPISSAIALLIKHDVRRLPIIDASKGGVLFANLSVSDFRGLADKDFARFDMAKWRVDTFLGTYSPQSLQPFVVDMATTTVVDLFQRLLAKNMYSVWVTDAAGKPNGSISVRSLIAAGLAFKEPKKTTTTTATH
jgi:CBS domain-containing protein